MTDAAAALAGALTPKQRAWAEYYANHGNGTQAAREAGYKGSDGALAVQSNVNLKNPKILAYLAAIPQVYAEAQEEEARPRIADALERQEFWSSVMRGEVKEWYFKDGNLIEKPNDMASRLKASELLGKRQGDFTEKVELTGKDGLPIQRQIEHSLEGKSLEELAALYKSWG